MKGCIRCTPKSECDRCKPKCDPCSKQPRIMYCGRPLPCVGVVKGQDLNRVVELLGDEICNLKQLISTQEVRLLPNPDCGEGINGFIIEIYDSSTDEVIESASICEPITEVNFYENGDLVATSDSVNFNSGDGVVVTSEVDVDTGQVSYTFDIDFSNCVEITYAEGLDLIANNEVDCNILYHITDRGYYLKGLNSNTFSISGHRIQKIIKPEYYYPTTPSIYKGVYNQYNITSASVGDVFIYGATVWRATSNVGTITPTNLLDIGVGFVQDTDPVYWEDAIFTIEYDYVRDVIISQTDVFNNKLEVLTTSPVDTALHCDWGQFGSNREGNKFKMWLNNNISALSTITNNIVGNVTGNKVKSLTDNKVDVVIRDNNATIIASNNTHEIINNKNKSSGIAIFKNNSHQINNNSLRLIRFNNVTSIYDNAGDDISYNKGYEIINNIFDKIRSNQTIFISGNNLGGSGLITSNSGSVISNNGIRTISGNKVDIISNNELPTTLSVTPSVMQYNVGYLITDNKCNDISFNHVRASIGYNTNVDISLNIAEAVSTNTGTPYNLEGTVHYPLIKSNNINNGINLNKVAREGIILNTCEDIVDNENCELRSNKVTDIRENYNCIIARNNNNGDINFNNLVAQQPLYEIIMNSNNGGIYNNQPTTTGLQIHNNHNNGSIGSAGSPTSRSGFVTDTVVNK